MRVCYLHCEIPLPETTGFACMHVELLDLLIRCSLLGSILANPQIVLVHLDCAAAAAPHSHSCNSLGVDMDEWCAGWGPISHQCHCRSLQ